MKPTNGEKEHFFDKRRNTKWVLRVFYVICALLLALDIVHHRHVEHPWESLWGFYGVYGFVACVALVLIAKEMRRVLMRGEDYYDPGAVAPSAKGGNGAADE